MARVPTAYQRPMGFGENARHYKIGVQEAGGTSVTAAGKIAEVIIYKNAYDAMTSDERTALKTLTFEELIDTLADTFYALTEM